MSDQSDLHNRIVGDIVRSIVIPPLMAGGDYKSVLVVLESVVAGVLLAMVKLGGDSIVLDTLLEGVKARVEEIMARERLGLIQPEGSA